MPSFEITKVEGEPRTWTAKKGPAAGQEFKSYTVRAKGPDGEEHTYEISRKPSSAPPSLGPVEADVQPSSGDFPDKLKLSYSGRQNGGGSQAKDDYWQKKEQRDIESQARMGRAHAQEMAIRWSALLAAHPTNAGPHSMGLDGLTEIIDWFHADVQRFPDAPQALALGPPKPWETGGSSDGKSAESVRIDRSADGGGNGSLSDQSTAAAASTPEPPSTPQKSKITQLLNKNVAMALHADLKAQATTKAEATTLISRLIKVDAGEADVNKLCGAYNLTPPSDIPYDETA